MVFFRSVLILYQNYDLFEENFGDDRLKEIYDKINEGDIEKIKTKLNKYLTKCYDNFSTKLSDDKKYEEKLQDVRICMSVAFTSTSVTQSTDTLKSKTLKKNLSQVSSKVQTWVGSRSKAPSTASSQRGSLGQTYKVINPEEKSNKILELCANPSKATVGSIKKLVAQSLS